MFDFLAERSLAGRTPKEVEIAIEVFGRSAGATIEDATVRVNIHKLRRKLDEYYLSIGLASGREDVDRIVIPRGEYRLVLQPMRVATQAEPPALETQSTVEAVAGAVQKLTPRNRRHWIAFMAAVLATNFLAWAMLLPTLSPAARATEDVRRSVIWNGVVDNERPIYVVVGDYYIFGELGGATMDVRRLVREFNINSRNDLERFLINNPQLADRYMDVSLQYLPISVAQALQQVLPVLNNMDEKAADRVRVILASELTPTMLKSGHIIYVGLLSGLGILRDPAFTGSQFEFGDSYDELVNRKDGKHYISQAAQVANSRTLYQDYGYFSTVTGPTGNRLIIIAGTRDVAAIHTAVAVTHSTSLAQLLTQAGVTSNFEALYAVNAIDRTDLNGRLLLASRLSTAMRP